MKLPPSNIPLFVLKYIDLAVQNLSKNGRLVDQDFKQHDIADGVRIISCRVSGSEVFCVCYNPERIKSRDDTNEHRNFPLTTVAADDLDQAVDEAKMLLMKISGAPIDWWPNPRRVQQ